MQFEISKPTEDGAFEDMCARIYVTVFNDPLPQTNGRRGQKQGGIDVFVDAPEGRLGVQCKKYADGALKFKHVEHEVSEADKANAPIVRLIVATTAMSDVVHLREVQDLTDARVAKGSIRSRLSSGRTSAGIFAAVRSSRMVGLSQGPLACGLLASVLWCRQWHAVGGCPLPPWSPTRITSHGVKMPT